MKLPILEPCMHSFEPKHFGSISQLLGDLGKGSEPIAIMVTCSELAYEPDHLSKANPGELIVIQTVGGVLHFSPNDVSEESAPFGGTLKHETLRHLIVCGHSGCEVFNLLLKPDDGKPKLMIHQFLYSVERRFKRVYADRPSQEHRQILIQESALQQLANIQARPDVKSRLGDGSLRLHAWVRNDEMSTIAKFDPATGQFET